MLDNTHHSARTAVLGLVSAALVFTTAGCGSGGSSGASATKKSPSTASTLLPQAVQKDGVLTIATDAQLPPNNFIGPDGKTIVGVSVDMADALAKVLGVKVNFVNVPFASLISGLQAGRYDIAMSGVTDTAEREKQVDFVDFIKSGQVFIVPAGNPGKVDSLEALCGKTATLVKGTISVDIAQEQSTKCTAAGKPAVKILQFPTAADALLQLQGGRADANIANIGKAAYQAKQSNGKLEVAGEPFRLSYDAVAVPKGDTAMIDALKYAFSKIIADGSYGEVLKKWDVQKSAVDKVAVNGADTLQ